MQSGANVNDSKQKMAIGFRPLVAGKRQYLFFETQLCKVLPLKDISRAARG
jgi:hypothetical protein